MLLAALGDIHGNLPALEAVLHEVDEQGIQTLLCTGDCLGGLPWTDEVVDVLRARGVWCVQGQMDRALVRLTRKLQAARRQYDDATVAALTWGYDHTHSETLEFLGTLPRTQTVRLEALDIFLCHGSPASQSDNLPADAPDHRFERARERAPHDIIVTGRTHRGFWRFVAETLFVNPGSVGLPIQGLGMAEYALVNTETEPWTVELREVPYDAAYVKRRLADAGLELPPPPQ